VEAGKARKRRKVLLWRGGGIGLSREKVGRHVRTLGGTELLPSGERETEEAKEDQKRYDKGQGVEGEPPLTALGKHST